MLFREDLCRSLLGLQGLNCHLYCPYKFLILKVRRSCLSIDNILFVFLFMNTAVEPRYNEPLYAYDRSPRYHERSSLPQ